MAHIFNPLIIIIFKLCLDSYCIIVQVSVQFVTIEMIIWGVTTKLVWRCKSSFQVTANSTHDPRIHHQDKLLLVKQAINMTF